MNTNKCTALSSSSITDATCGQSEEQQRDSLVKEYMPLVYKIAYKIFAQLNSNIELEDLAAWGTTGLLEAISRFDPSREVKLSTFAYWRIRGAMLDGIGTIAPLSRKGYRQARSLNDNHAIYTSDVSSDMILDHRKDISPEDMEMSRQTHQVLSAALATLSKEQRTLVVAHYFKGMSLKHAGEDLGISKSWACRSHARALKSLRSEMNKSLSLAA